MLGPSFQFSSSVLSVVSTVELEVVESKLELKVVHQFAKLDSTSVFFICETGVENKLEERVESFLLWDGLNSAKIHSHYQIDED